MNPWYAGGGLLAGWAVVVSLLGLMRPGFPGGSRAGRLVMAISLVLVCVALASAIYGAIAEEQEHGPEARAGLGVPA